MSETSKLKLCKQYNVELPTLLMTIQFLSQPGAMSDPRRHVTPIAMRDGPMKLSDVQVGSVLNGTIRNLTSFGAFVDIGVGTDGLLHTSQMNTHQKNNSNVAMGAGMSMKVVVLEVDVSRKRISLGCVGCTIGNGGGGNEVGNGRSGNSTNKQGHRGNKKRKRFVATTATTTTTTTTTTNEVGNGRSGNSTNKQGHRGNNDRSIRARTGGGGGGGGGGSRGNKSNLSMEDRIRLRKSSGNKSRYR